MSSSASSTQANTTTKNENEAYNLQGSSGNIISKGSVSVIDGGAISGNVDVAKSALTTSSTIAKNAQDNSLAMLKETLAGATPLLKDIVNNSTNATTNAIAQAGAQSRSDNTLVTQSFMKYLLIGGVGIAAIFGAVKIFGGKNHG